MQRTSNQQKLATAFSYHQAGNLAKAADLYRQIIKSDPANANATHYLGVVEANLGHLEQARSHMARSLAIAPTSMQFIENYAALLFKTGEYESAVQTAERGLRIHDAGVPLIYVSAVCLFKLQRYEESLIKFDRLLLIEPNHLDAINERASVLAEMKKYDEAIAGVEKALAIRPQYAEAHLNRGNIYCALKRYPEAIDAYNKAITLNSRLAEAYFGRGAIFYHLNLNDEAIADFEQAIAIKPDYAEARFYSCFAELPVLYKSQDEIIRRRESYKRKLRAISDDVGAGRAHGNLVKGATIRAPFYLAYQGNNDRDLQTLYGSLVCRIVGRKYAAPRLPPPPARGEVIRVGIVSSLFYRHSNWKIPIKGWISQLDRRRFHVTAYHVGAMRDEETEAASRLCDCFVHHDLDANGWREEILSGAPHVLIYPSLLMDNICTGLAAQRLAPVQCNSWGHPETSGMPTVDYFLSSDLMEPPEAADHYSERLVRLPNLSIYYEPAQMDASAPDRAEYGLRSDAVVFFCGQSLFKFLPQFDQVFASIAKRVANCQFVFLRVPSAERINILFQERLDRAFSSAGLNASEYCLMLPFLSHSQFMSLVGLCDIFLDSVGWSGCNTTLESLTHDLPIVTMPQAFMRSRHSAAILQMMGIDETIARTLDEYVSIAAELANDSGNRHMLSRKIADSKSRVYRDRAPIAALQEFLENAVSRTS